MRLDPDRFDALTFDCYGTLIDWERGLLDAIRPFAARASAPIDDQMLLTTYARHEAAAERGEFRQYKEVTRIAMEGVCAELGIAITRDEADAISRSIGDWPAFSDTVGAMRALKSRFKLCVCSNIDRDLFEGSRARLGVEVDAVVTAEDVGSYKPASGHFERAPAVLGIDRSRILHVAQSLYHDIGPARSLGYTTVWINRQRGRWGATPRVDGDVRPDFEAPDLATLAAWLVPDFRE
ncbi:MAG: haloacid dehalogenase type II [Phycisphaeraceae bacterium]|nr:MAG: haloacid dehalogenase type II [Phycisphaeraceae bacterium]